MAGTKAPLKFVDCVQYITEQKYRDALKTLKNALGDLAKAKRTPKGRDLARLFLTVVVALEKTLKSAYGHDWETQIPKISEEYPSLICSFCGKDQDEVLKLIAGPKVYI